MFLTNRKKRKVPVSFKELAHFNYPLFISISDNNKNICLTTSVRKGSELEN